MNYKFDNCARCKRVGLIINKRHNLCRSCNRIRLDGQKSDRAQNKGITTTFKVKVRVLPPFAPKTAYIAYKRGAYRPRKPTGEAKLFKRIWSERLHYCEHCGVGLGNEARAHYFSHIKSKGAHPELRLDPNNIKLLCMECHRIYDTGTQKQFEQRKNKYLK